MGLLSKREVQVRAWMMGGKGYETCRCEESKREQKKRRKVYAQTAKNIKRVKLLFGKKGKSEGGFSD